MRSIFLLLIIINAVVKKVHQKLTRMSLVLTERHKCKFLIKLFKVCLDRVYGFPNFTQNFLDIRNGT